MRKILTTLIFLVFATNANAQKVAVADAMTIPINAGEAQSTVVPPGKKTQCKNGRFLVTHDLLHPPASAVWGRNLNQNAGQPVASTWDMGALAANYNVADLPKSNYYFGTNDHDLVTLSNGDVLYITGAFTRMPLSPQVAAPAWFKDTFRAQVCSQINNCTSKFDFGPNARSTILVFRSTDCGEKFKFVAEMDPLHFGGGTCALPQFRRDWQIKDAPIIQEKPYDMGGTDGQLVKVDSAKDRVYLTFQCVGYHSDPAKKPEFVLDLNNRVNRTMVMMFKPSDASWKNLGYINQAAWRLSVLPFANDELAFGFSSSVLYGKKNAKGEYVFDSNGVVAPNGSFSWSGEWDFLDKDEKSTVPLDLMHTNVLAVPVIARSPDSKNLVLAFPDRFGTQGFGYRVFFYDRSAKTLVESGSPILPAEAKSDNLVFHVAVADPGSGGPVLLYWTDLDSSAKSVTVRGRLITAKDTFTNDFVISRTGGQPTSFQLAVADYWFGDYHTASAFFRKANQTASQGQANTNVASAPRYEYYPMWVEPNGTVRYTRVVYGLKKEAFTFLPQKVTDLEVKRVPPEKWEPQPPPIELSRIRRAARPVSRERQIRLDAGARP